MRIFSTILLLFFTSATRADFVYPKQLGDELIYGVHGGILIGLCPAALDSRPEGGPRGVVRVGYEENGKRYLINYFAIEPVIKGNRGYSELETGADGKPGKQLTPGKAKIQTDANGQSLSVSVDVDRFKNGAHAVIEFTFYEKFPDRLRLRTFAAPESKPMDQCIVTATMGNQSHCRWLWLDEKPIFAPAIYNGYMENQFIATAPFELKQLHRTKAGDVIAAISPNEFQPNEVWPVPGLNMWHHEAKWLAQYWLKPKGTFDDSLQCCTNGRCVYWAGDLPLPGGLAYENFELRDRFHSGDEFWFGFTDKSPAGAFNFSYDASPDAAKPRTIDPAEQKQIDDAAQHARPLTNGDFTDNLNGWQRSGGADAFKRIWLKKEMGVSTQGDRAAADTGRISQSFLIPADATELHFTIHGGADWDSLYVALWNGDRLFRKMTGSNSATPFEVRWDLKSLRGKVVTLEIVDQSTAEWGYIATGPFGIMHEGSANK